MIGHRSFAIRARTDGAHPQVEATEVLDPGGGRRRKGHSSHRNHDLGLGADRVVFAVRSFAAVGGTGGAGAVDDLRLGGSLWNVECGFSWLFDCAGDT